MRQPRKELSNPSSWNTSRPSTRCMRLPMLGVALRSRNNQGALWTPTKISAKVINRTNDITETPASTSWTIQRILRQGCCWRAIAPRNMRSTPTKTKVHCRNMLVIILLRGENSNWAITIFWFRRTRSIKRTSWRKRDSNLHRKRREAMPTEETRNNTRSAATIMDKIRSRIDTTSTMKETAAKSTIVLTIRSRAAFSMRTQSSSPEAISTWTTRKSKTWRRDWWGIKISIGRIDITVQLDHRAILWTHPVCHNKTAYPIVTAATSRWVSMKTSTKARCRHITRDSI